MTLTDDQQQLQDVLRSALAPYAPEGPLRELDSDAGWRAWAVMVDQIGVAGLGIPEARAGVGGALIDQVIVAEELGRALMRTPFLTSSVISGRVLSRSESPAAADLVEAIVAGTVVATVLDGSGVLSGTGADGDTVLNGTAPVVDAADADFIVVPYRGDVGEAYAWVLDARAAGVNVETSGGIDADWPYRELVLNDVPVESIAFGADYDAVVADADAVSTIALAAEAVGVAAAALEGTVAYVGQREQFGQPIGAFQAVAHACADMFVDVESGRALVRESAIAYSDGSARRAVLASTAFHYATGVAQRVCGQAIHLHGGIGFTWEHWAHRRFKRVAAIRSMTTTPVTHFRRVLAALTEDAGP